MTDEQWISMFSGPLALDPRAAMPVARMVVDGVRGSNRDRGAWADARQAQEQRAEARETGSLVPVVGLVRVHGMIIPRGPSWLQEFGFSVVESLQQQVIALAGNDEVRAIVLDIDSPGGVVSGVEELAETVRSVNKAAGGKPVIAHAWDWALSAAYWVASAADEIVVTPSGEVGSVGVWSLHLDYSESLKEAGIKPTFIIAGKYKTEGNPFEPLSDEGREYEQQQVDKTYKKFVADVARGRGVSPQVVRDTFGQGRVVDSTAALANGMVDRIATFSDTLKRAAGPVRRGQKSEADRLIEEQELNARETFARNRIAAFGRTTSKEA